MFLGDIEDSDINQGQLGNCWFLTCLSAIASKRKFINNIFISQEYQPKGFYRLRLCVHGEWQNVTIDDYIPCYTDGGPVFSHSNGSEL
mmetsp:Transcript_7623/g.995  ORF Transcript_7623/g.995 Transcript_7623/m.995 type:complete len:88 (+) Transcript_7623:551-814(+)